MIGGRSVRSKTHTYTDTGSGDTWQNETVVDSLALPIGSHIFLKHAIDIWQTYVGKWTMVEVPLMDVWSGRKRGEGSIPEAGSYAILA
jgi:hypothetical protein